MSSGGAVRFALHRNCRRRPRRVIYGHECMHLKIQDEIVMKKKGIWMHRGLHEQIAYTSKSCIYPHAAAIEF